MKNQAVIVKEAFKLVFKKKTYVLGTAITALMVFITVIFVPVFTVPGNDLSFQLSIMPLRDFLIIGLLGILTGISIMLNVFLFRREKKDQIEKTGVMTITSGFGVISSFLGSVTCIACASTILGFLGLGTVTFILAYRLPLVLLSSLFILLSIYFTSRKVLNYCDVCNTKK